MRGVTKKTARIVTQVKVKYKWIRNHEFRTNVWSLISDDVMSEHERNEDHANVYWFPGALHPERVSKFHRYQWYAKPNRVGRISRETLQGPFVFADKTSETFLVATCGHWKPFVFFLVLPSRGSSWPLLPIVVGLLTTDGRILVTAVQWRLRN